MQSDADEAPAFGQADLSNCEREQIHLAGAIQPHGALLVVEGPDLAVIQASQNAAEVLGLDGVMLGSRLDCILPDLAAKVSPLLNDPALLLQPALTHCLAGPQRGGFDVLVHRVLESGAVIELERAAPRRDHAAGMDAMIQAIVRCLTLRTLCDETARLVRELTGYDRVMVYRFDRDGHGEVVAEARGTGMESFLGNWYPASDIPQIARRLYERNRVRVLVDVGYEPIPIVPECSPTGRKLDMSLCALRAVSPIHVQYLQNMGVSATLVASLMVGGRLWGLIACHHNTPRLVPFETRTACEMLAEACATRLAALESFAHGQAELSVRRLQQRLVQAAAIDGDWRAALFETRQLLLPLRASGAALLFEGQVTAVGTAPGAADVSAIANWLCGEGSVTATASLSLDEPHFETLADIASGVLSVSLGGGDYLLWFRPERVRTITWGGEPHKPRAPAGPPTGANSAHPLSPADLSPRRSFAQWHQLVQRTSEPWLEPELAAARLIGGVVSDMIVHSRAMGLLVAHDQLDQVHQQLSDAGQPVLVAERGGRVLLANSAVRHLLGNPSVQQLDDLPALFQDRQAVAGMLQVLQERHVPWGGELALAARGSVMLSAEPISADPATSSSGPILGYVLTFVDLAPQKAAEAARARLQAGIADRTRRMVSGSAADATFEAVLTSVLQNAQLAAMEIADSADDEHMPERLDSLRRSVARTVHVLEQLLRPRHQ